MKYNTFQDSLRWCNNCVMMSTRPRISFDKRGWCNACLWAEKKKSVNWDLRKVELNNLLDKYRSENGEFDCIVPCSGGKDGSYVAYNLKHKYGMNPLCITVTPALTLELGNKNLEAFIKSGYNHISINADYEGMRVLNKMGFIELGFPYYGWLISIHTAVIKVAFKFGINLIFYGEDGEIEYGGSTETQNNPIYNINYQKKVYLESGYEKILSASSLNSSSLTFFKFPSENELKDKDINITHWSYFENWNPYTNYLVAKDKCGLMESEASNSGTFTNFAQNDQVLYALHAYLMYLKYGFGRATQDACIEIRRGAMDRSQAVNLVRLFDGQYPPENYIKIYLDYYQMTMDEFDGVIDRYANRDLFEKIDGYWKPIFTLV